MATILIALAALGGLTLILALMLILANRKLYVYEDPRIDTVEEMLPHANCGACGYPGCRPFAEALVSGEALPGKCTVSTEEGRQRIAEYLGVDMGAQEKRVARLACAGGTNWRANAPNTAASPPARRRRKCPAAGKIAFGAASATAIAMWPATLTPSP